MGSHLFEQKTAMLKTITFALTQSQTVDFLSWVICGYYESNNMADMVLHAWCDDDVPLGKFEDYISKLIQVYGMS